MAVREQLVVAALRSSFVCKEDRKSSETTGGPSSQIENTIEPLLSGVLRDKSLN